MTQPALYIHVPFCARACPYCDFDFEVGRRPKVDDWWAGLEREWDARHLGDVYADDGPETLYVGGGTPSLLGPAGIFALARWLGDRSIDVEAAAERTFEVNPEHVEASLLHALREVGFDRVSLGVQSFRREGLRQLGRMHDRARAIAAIEQSVASGLRTSVDIIVGWPGQTIDACRDDLRIAIDLGVRHLSVYALTIEPNTPWQRLVARGARVDPDSDRQAALLVEVERFLVERGWEHYEISNYGYGERSLHNEVYWTSRDYIGIGPSAASAQFEPGVVHRRTNARGLALWASGAAPEQEQLRAERGLGEALWVGLRRLDGVDRHKMAAQWGVDPEVMTQRIARACELGNLEEDGRVIRMRPDRWLWHDALAATLLA